jgi:HK97 family phage prohead protease
MEATNDQVERARAGVEHRIIGSSIEFREILPDEDKDGKPLPVLQGYAARFNTRSLPLAMIGFREEIDLQAFDESLAKNPDVRFTFNHNPNKVYGRTKAGTLRCWRDDNGLRFEVALPRHHDAEGLAESIKRGDVTQCSFSFRTLDDDWSRDDEGNIVRRLLKVDIDNGDVAAVTFPAYPDTDVSVRSLDDAIGEQGAKRLIGRLESEIAAAAARDRDIELAKLE